MIKLSYKYIQDATTTKPGDRATHEKTFSSEADYQDFVEQDNVLELSVERDGDNVASRLNSLFGVGGAK